MFEEKPGKGVLGGRRVTLKEGVKERLNMPAFGLFFNKFL